MTVGALKEMRETHHRRTCMVNVVLVDLALVHDGESSEVAVASRASGGGESIESVVRRVPFTPHVKYRHKDRRQMLVACM